MAVVDLNNFTGTAVKAFKVGGTDALLVLGKAEITSGDSIASIYRIAKIPANYVPFELELNCEAITSVNDADVGFYLDGEFGGAVVDKDILADGIDISSALALGSELNVLSALTVDLLGSTVAELLSDGKAEYQTYDLALTINAAATATGSVSFRGIFINGA